MQRLHQKGSTFEVGTSGIRCNKLQALILAVSTVVSGLRRHTEFVFLASSILYIPYFTALTF
jgi:hypothetical protein